MEYRIYELWDLLNGLFFEEKLANKIIAKIEKKYPVMDIQEQIDLFYYCISYGHIRRARRAKQWLEQNITDFHIWPEYIKMEHLYFRKS